MVCAAVALNITVLVAPKVPNVGLVVLDIVSVALFATLIVPVTCGVAGIVKIVLGNEVLLPTVIVDEVPETVQLDPIVGFVPKSIWYVWLLFVKLGGVTPTVPSELAVQLAATVRSAFALLLSVCQVHAPLGGIVNVVVSV